PTTLQAKKLGFREIIDIATLGLPYFTSGLAVTKTYLSRNEETVRNFTKAYVEGISVGKKEKQFSMNVIGKYTKTDDKEALEDAYEYFIPKLFPRVPTASAGAVQAILDEVASDNPKAKEFKPEAFIDNRLVKELEDSGFIRKLYE
ncbi:MAG: hypothetical protein HY675_15630, partial [Chloroflexi bacterium]|nr:hypothetical protein [Chloroflexota bacterium]